LAKFQSATSCWQAAPCSSLKGPFMLPGSRAHLLAKAVHDVLTRKLAGCPLLKCAECTLGRRGCGQHPAPEQSWSI